MRACPSNLTTLGAALPQINLVEQLILETFLRWNSKIPFYENISFLSFLSSLKWGFFSLQETSWNPDQSFKELTGEIGGPVYFFYINLMEQFRNNIDS
jgi:hypothetical protein